GNSLIHRDSLAPFGAHLSHFATLRTCLAPHLLSLRTSLERKAPESLTLPGSGFVLRNMRGQGAGDDTRSSLGGANKGWIAAAIPKFWRGWEWNQKGRRVNGNSVVLCGLRCTLSPCGRGWGNRAKRDEAG